MTLEKVAVVGAGTIGRGVAQSLAQSGLGVSLIDISQGQLDRAMADIAQSLRLAGLFRQHDGHGSSPQAARAVLERIAPSRSIEDVAGAGFVIENVTENWDIKRDVYLALDRIAEPAAIFGVNTSAVSITKVAAVTARAPQVIGLHFMNPVPLMPTVEVIRGHFTSDDTLAAAEGLLKMVGKEGIVVGDFPGFVTNRILMLTINEAVFCIQDQVSTATDIDRMFKGCFGHKMGPLQTADLIGLDTVLNSLTVMYESYRDCKFRPAPLLQKLVDAGQIGRKSGAGFYQY